MGVEITGPPQDHNSLDSENRTEGFRTAASQGLETRRLGEAKSVGRGRMEGEG